MILLHSTPGAEEDKVAPPVTFADLKKNTIHLESHRKEVYQYG